MDGGGRQEKRRHVGRRIRRRRLFLGLTQQALADALGVTFQQVQKYEKGVSPVPAARLSAIARMLEVPPDYFSRHGAEEADSFESFVESPEGVALYRAMAMIPDAATRTRLVMAVAAFSDSAARPEENETALMARWLARIAQESDSDRHNRNVAASVRAMKVELAELIGKTLKARKLTQKFAARILATDQARISALSRGNVEATSFEKLLRYLVLLGWDAHLAIDKRPVHAKGKIKLTSKP
ncbi:MAG TPA: helix-turn-helix transcriptional regulator [Rhizomicrobium sp.]|nr:helix-turn-helix transcriptional regulator [Rhizomicrobium sp.]